MKGRIAGSLWMIGVLLLAQNAAGYTELSFAPDAVSLTPEPGSTADKARLQRLADGTIVALWHDGTGSADGAWDLGGTPYSPRDVFVRTSVDGGSTWSAAVNLSNTAALTDPSAFYDRVGDGSGLANYYGDSDKPTVFSSGNNMVVIWNDAYCGDGVHGPARYEGPSGLIEVPFKCLYAARVTVLSGVLDVISVDRITDATRDVTNEVSRATGAGFALAWQEDRLGLQPGEGYGEGDGASGARVTPGTDVWYTSISTGSFANPAATWRNPVPVSDNFDYAGETVTGGGASRPILAMAGSPPTAILLYEEAKNAGPTDPGKYVMYHQFPFASPPVSESGVVISTPDENARRARVVAQSTAGGEHGTRMVVMWRQGEGIHGAPADFMMRVGRVPPGTDVAAVPSAGFRVDDLWPAVDPAQPVNSAPPLNLSGAELDDDTSIDPVTDAKAHRAVLDGDTIFAGYIQDESVDDALNTYQYFVRSSSDGGTGWTVPLNVSAAGSGAAEVIEPRLMRTPGTIPSGEPEDIRNPDIYLFAWGTQTVPGEGVEPAGGSLFVTRTRDRGATLEPVQTLDVTRTSASQTDEQIQLNVTPDGENVAAVWVRRDGAESFAMFGTAVGVTRTADLVMTAVATTLTPDVGDPVTVTFSVRNNGPDVATGVELSASLGAGLTLVSATAPSGFCDVVADVSCSLEDLAPGQSADLELALIADAAGQLPATASVSAAEVEPVPADNAHTLIVEGIPNAELSLTLLRNIDRIDSGVLFRVDTIVVNAGPQTATDVRTTVNIPADIEVMDAPGCGEVSGNLLCRLPALAAGGSSRVSFALRGTRKGDALFRATTSATEADPDADNNSAQVTVTIVHPGGGGCSYNPGGDTDTTLPLLLLTGVFARLLRRGQAGRAL